MTDFIAATPPIKNMPSANAGAYFFIDIYFSCIDFDGAFDFFDPEAIGVYCELGRKGGRYAKYIS